MQSSLLSELTPEARLAFMVCDRTVAQEEESCSSRGAPGPLGSCGWDPLGTLNALPLCPLMQGREQNTQGAHMPESDAKERLASLLPRVRELAVGS